MNKKILISLLIICLLFVGSACGNESKEISAQVLPETETIEESTVKQEVATPPHQYALFSDILGYRGYSVSIKDHEYFETRYYFAVENGDHFIIAESFGAEKEDQTLDDSFIDDYILDINGDGVNELICNCIYGGDGHKEAYIFKNDNGKIKKGYFDRKQLKDLPEDLIDFVSSVITEFDPVKNKLKVDYISTQKDSEYTTLYVDISKDVLIWEDWSIDEETLMDFNSHGTSLLGSAHTVKYTPFKDILGFSGYILDDYYPIEGYITRSYCAIEDGKAYYFADARIFEEYLSDNLVDVDSDGELELITNNIRMASSLAEAVIYKRTGDIVKYGIVKDASCSYFDCNNKQFEIHMDSDEDKTIYLSLDEAEITWLGEMEK